MYSDSAYAVSLHHMGTPVALPGSGGWLLRREIGPRGSTDYAGPYPLFCCTDWTRLRDDLWELGGSGGISVVLVPDPFGAWSPSLLESTFDVVRAVKRRSIVDLRRPLENTVSGHHRQRSGRAMRRLQVERCDDPRRWAAEWTACYSAFAAAYGFTGPSAFPPSSLVAQLSVQGVVMYRAAAGADTVGFLLWMRHGAVAYNHLTAYTPAARRAGAAYALYWTALHDLQASGVERADLGGGVLDDDSLARWKAGWTPASVPGFICGSVLRPDAYAALVRGGPGEAASLFFPAYRAAQ